MNISYEKSKLLKDIETKYPRTNKNRFTRNLLNLLYLLNPHTQPTKSIIPIKSAHPPTNGIRAQQFKTNGRDIY